MSQVAADQKTPCQYDVWYKGMVIESTGYMASEREAVAFAKKRFGKRDELFVSRGYPDRSPEKIAVWPAKKAA